MKIEISEELYSRVRVYLSDAIDLYEDLRADKDAKQCVNDAYELVDAWDNAVELKKRQEL